MGKKFEKVPYSASFIRGCHYCKFYLKRCHSCKFPGNIWHLMRIDLLGVL